MGNAVPSLLAELLALEIRSQLLHTKRRVKTPRLLTPHRGPSPAALRPAPVPKKYHDLAGDDPEHPGDGLGSRRLKAYSLLASPPG